MSLLTSIISPVRDAAVTPRSRRATLKDADGWFVDTLRGGSPSASGEIVSPTTAVTLSGYFAGIRAISEDVGKLPFKVYERQKGGAKKEQPSHPVYQLLHDAPNPEQSAMNFREFLTSE